MNGIVVKCTERRTVDSINGPLTYITLVPDGPLNTNRGEITLFTDDAAYQVGRMFVLTPKTYK